MEVSTQSIKKVTHTLKLSAFDIIELLNGRRDHILPEVPADATVVFAVPGGGDYSNTNVEVDFNAPIVVTWTFEVNK